MRPIRSISVHIPTWQGMEFLRRVLDALAGQVVDVPWDVHVIDSNSTDGTYEYLEERAASFPVPLELDRIQQVEFDHGDTRNLLASRSSGDLLVFLTQDAIPSSPDWLRLLAANFQDPEIGAAYSRNLPRPDARLSTKVLSAADPGYSPKRQVVRRPPLAVYEKLDAEERRRLYNFNDVASAIRRELWELHPFPRANFGEDVLMARALIEAGHGIVYDVDATVEHSHDYDVEQTYRRGFVDGRFNAEWLDRVAMKGAKDVRILAAHLGDRDARELHRLGVVGTEAAPVLAELHALRLAVLEGLYDGGRSMRRHPRTRMRKTARLKVLFVVHGFPPDTWAGTEVYTLGLARELAARGHDVVILARSPARTDDEEDFKLYDDEVEGLRVRRVVHRLEHGSLEETYSQPRIEAVFTRVLLEERPTVVHFQHLIHLSAGCVEIARSFGLPTIQHCHDFWALCARVQMIRPDGERCPENMGSGCFACIKEEHLDRVPLLHRLDGLLGVLPTFAARMIERCGVEGATAEIPLAPESRARARAYRELRTRETFVPAAYATADLCISPSRFLRDMYLQTGKFDPVRFLYSDNGMRTDHVAALQKTADPEGRVRFGFVGTLVWYKGGEVMLRAMERLVGRSAVLYIYGSFNPETDEHHARLRGIAGPNVVFKGRFDNSRLADVYAEIDVLIVPSLWYENSPVTIHEAYLCATPVVASDIGGMAEYVTDGKDGLLFETGSEVDLARCLTRFLDEPGLIPALSQSFMRVKTMAENAAETEFRYRALCCIERVAECGPQPLLDITGQDTFARSPGVENQDADLVLLRPGSFVEYSLAELPRGPVTLVFDLFLMGKEVDVEHGGRFEVAGEELALLELCKAKHGDEVVSIVFDVEVGEEAQVVRVVSERYEGATATHMRIKRMRALVLFEEPSAPDDGGAEQGEAAPDHARTPHDDADSGHSAPREHADEDREVHA